jgi:PIN domain nuclease of toxin-antitoxin system
VRGLLLDTHTWFWFVLGSERLPMSLRDRIDSCLEPHWLSPISVWEVLMLAAKGRVHLGLEPREWVQTALERFPVHEAPLNFEVALRSRELALSHGDPADAFLVATALIYDLVLVTVDRRLTALDWIPTLSA